MNDSAPSPTAGYRHMIPMTIRYGDMDTLGHVNNAKYLTYVEQGRIHYVRDLGLWDGGLSEYGMIVARITIDYKLPLTMDDGTVQVWTRTSRLGNKSFDVESLIVTERGGTPAVAAMAQAVIVVMDYQQNVPVGMPQAWRDIVTGYEPALQG